VTGSTNISIIAALDSVPYGRLLSGSRLNDVQKLGPLFVDEADIARWSA
jgi:hypothetical protein